MNLCDLVCSHVHSRVNLKVGRKKNRVTRRKASSGAFSFSPGGKKHSSESPSSFISEPIGADRLIHTGGHMQIQTDTPRSHPHSLAHTHPHVCDRITGVRNQCGALLLIAKGVSLLEFPGLCLSLGEPTPAHAPRGCVCQAPEPLLWGAVDADVESGAKGGGLGQVSKGYLKGSPLPSFFPPCVPSSCFLPLFLPCHSSQSAGPFRP